MRVGILGGGGISDTHVRAARGIEGVEIAAVHGANPEKIAALAATAGAADCATLDQFFAHPLDMVAIGSPSGLHAAQALESVRRGIPVLVEKPLDIATAKIDVLLEAADRAGVAVGVCFQDRLSPQIAALKRRLDSGALGAPLFASAQVHWYRPPEYYRASRWRGTWEFDGGGALMNQGIHTLDLLLWMLGPVRRVTGTTATRLHDIAVEDTAAAMIEFESGATAAIDVTTAAFPGWPRRIQITGTRGIAVHEDPARPAVVADATPHRRVFEDFIAALRDRRPPACDGYQGRRSVALVEAIYRSAQSGRSETP